MTKILGIKPPEQMIFLKDVPLGTMFTASITPNGECKLFQKRMDWDHRFGCDGDEYVVPLDSSKDGSSFESPELGFYNYQVVKSITINYKG